MTKVIVRTQENELDTLEQDLQKIKDRVRTVYWEKHNAMNATSYKSQHDQMDDAISLGKIAEAQRAILAATSALQEIPRR